MTKRNYAKTKYACYFTSLAMTSVFTLPPLLFAAFQTLYGISYTLLGTLVVVNFCTQLLVDLIFSFQGNRFNIHKIIRTMPLITTLGLCIYALIPTLFPQYAYAGLVTGTFIFSVAAGLNEILTSSAVAALPSDTPEKDMSTLHSLYGYGFVSVVLISTVFLRLAGKQYWMYLTLFWAILPVIASVLLAKSPFPDMHMEKPQASTAQERHRATGIVLCMICIFLGSAAENTMSNWISVYAEKALHIPKIWGDILGMSMFAALLALTRTAYAKYGKDISKTLLISMAGSVVCYVTVALSPSAVVSLIACVVLGIFSSMLWPGTLILMEEKIPAIGVTAYALMAAGGDLGASVAPQTIGIVVDKIALTQWAKHIPGLSPEQVGFQAGMLTTAAFPALGILVLLYIRKHFNHKQA